MNQAARLFDTVPRLEGESIVLRELVPADAPALEAFARNEAVYRFLPTFLYEQKYADARYAIEHYREECLDTRTCVIWAICLADSPDEMIGLYEVYNLGDEGHKASIGCRISDAYWGRGVATEATRLVTRYLFDDIGLDVITAHVMEENNGSCKMLEKAGFAKQGEPIVEDWERGEPVHAYKFVLTPPA